jgi:cytidylate kinase
LNYHDLSLSLVEALLHSHGNTTSQRAPSPGAAGQTAPRPPCCLTISREAGALGNSVATAVGKRLNWPVYDREILDRIGQEMRRPPHHLAMVDERPGNWLEESLSSLLSEYHVSADTYLKYLIGTVRGLGTVGQCVIVGRGANYILPAETTLRVRLVAALQDRVQVIARRLRLSEREAGTWVEKTERQRLEFVKRYFRKDSTDPHDYDLVLNMSRLSVDDAAELLIQMLQRFEGRAAVLERKPQPEASGPSVPAMS